MTELGHYRKAELIELAKEYGIEIVTTETIPIIIRKIESSEYFDKESVVAQLRLIREERLEKAEREKIEHQARTEREKIEHQARTEREKIEHEARIEREKLQFEAEERERERNFELEKLRTIQLNETESLGSVREERKKVMCLKNIIQNFDPEKAEISVYLALFERQAEEFEIPEEQWITQLLPLLPINLAEIILRESKTEPKNYKHVKEVLLSRLKVNAETFRRKFTQSQRTPGQLWKDFNFELNTYLEGWVGCLEITSLEGLKNLMIADQIKRRTTLEMKDHFIDSWAKLVNPKELAEKLDEYESVRKPLKKMGNTKINEERKFEKPRSNEKERERKLSDKKPFNWREKNENDRKEKEKYFEKRRSPACYECGSLSHLRPSCPRLKGKDYTSVNHVGDSNILNSSFEPYLSTALVNKVETVILRDSGSNLDLIPGKLITPQKLNGEVVWLKQALENEFHCLPVANVELEIEGLGIINTKAAVVDTTIKMDYYLLGNHTQELIDQFKSKRGLVHAVVTRNQSRNRKNESEEPEVTAEPPVLAEVKDNGVCDLPPIEENGELALSRIEPATFRIEQKKDPSLSILWDKGRNKSSSEFTIENEVLFRVTKDHHGNKRKQIIVPTKMRKNILSLCHDGIGGHMGATKTKDKILRLYFWPNAIKDIENYVKTCDACQKVGKAREKIKAPLKLVPVIQEIFTRVNCDLVGPLTESKRNNKYLLTAMCLSSKYPEAIPIRDATSDTVIEGLLTVFSRLGFPRELQCDLGSCFTSELTSTFCEKFGIKLVHSSVHRPESNAIERWHRSVKRLLKVLCLESGESWEKTLPLALLALRTVTHTSTGFSPAELVHGKNLRTPETLLFEKWIGLEDEETPVTEYIFELINRMKRCQDLAIEKMEETRNKRKEWYDRDAVERTFKPGDQVLVMATFRPNKLSVSWIGPGTIVRKLSDTNYIVNVPGRREKSQIYHINLLKPYHKRVELVNVLLKEEECDVNSEADLEIVYPTSTPDAYDFSEIVRESALTEKFPPDKIEQLRMVLEKHKEIFSNEPGRTDLIEHDIELISEKPFRIKPYRSSPRQTEILRQEIKRMLDLNLIEEGESDYTSPMILVEAPGRDPRPCVDYRKLNSITKTEFFPLPNIEERIEQVAAAKFISLCDLTRGYFQVPLTPRAQRYATFVTSFGSYRPLVMSFGLVNAPFAFSKLMANLLKGCEDFCVPYLDDIATFSNTWEEHLNHLDIIMNKLTAAKLRVKPAKCRFAQDCVKYLGHMVGNGKRTPSEAKIQAVLDFPTPKTKTEIRKILGMVGYYARYIENYAIMVEPLTRALKGKKRKEGIVWTEEMEMAFADVKRKLTEKPVLYAPDYGKEFIVQSDASDIGIGVVLAQRTGAEEHPVLYLSRKFTRAEKNYSTTEKECAAIIFAIKKLKHYLDGQKFTIETDHNPLKWLKTNSGNNPRLLRWALALQPFNYNVEHRPGKLISHADCLSRL